MNKIYYFLLLNLLFLASFYSCNNYEKSHWHLTGFKGKTPFFSTIDFDDSIVYINKHNTINSMFFSKNDTNNILIEIGGFETLEYRIDNNNLILKSKNDNSKLVKLNGIRTSSKCNLETDIFIFDNIETNISLAKTSFPKKKLHLRELILLELIIYPEKDSNSTNTAIYSRKEYKHIELSQINKIVNKRSKNLMTKDQDKGDIILYVDQNLNMYEFNKIIKELKNCGKDIYIALITNNIEVDTEELTFIKTDTNITYNENQKFSEWIETEFVANSKEN